MTSLPLRWHKFKNWDDVRLRYKSVTKAKGVYAVATPTTILYIGHAIGNNGLWDRYNGRGIINAALDRTRKRIYFAQVEQLIWNEVAAGNARLLKENRQLPKASLGLRFQNKGTPPPFA
jgi:hypothetical protein